MNANELADEFRDGKTFWQPDQILDWGYEAETMLRQKQSEIEALEQSKDRLIKTLLDVRGQQPVAYVNKYADGKELLDNGTDLTAEESTPLYTHPVKELTDEEIHDLMDEIRQAVGDDIERAMYRMARAILRKAQEK